MGTLAGLGGFFAVAAPPALGDDAVPWTQVLAAPVLQARFDAVRSALAGSSGLPVEEIDPKVAVSATQVGLASRLWSVALGAVVLHGWVPDLSGANLVASPGHRGQVPLGVRDPGAGYAVRSPEEAAARIAQLVADDALAALEAACAEAGRTPRRVLASNSTSALVGGARVLAGLRPAHADAAWTLTRGLLRHTSVAAGGSAVDPQTLPSGVGGAMQRPDEAFLRTGCCVFYRLPGHGLCPDCVLAPSRHTEVTPSH